MGVVFTNNAETTLAAAITSTSATSISVTSSSTFPAIQAGEHFYATLDDGTNNEIVKVTGVSGTTWTVVRASDNTTARTFANGITVQLRATAALLTDIQENIAAKSANQTVFSATTASSATDYDVGQDPGVEANASVFLDGVYQHHDTFSFSGSTLTFDTAPVDGTALEVIIDNLVNLQSSNLTVDTFTAADVGGNPQVDFVLSDAPAAETNLIVFVDGVFQANDTYTISATTLSMTDGITADRIVTVYVMNPVNIGTPSDGTITSAKLSGDITTPGSLTVGSNDVAFDSPTFVVDNTNSRVGLGTASPSVPVDIVGDVKMSANLTVDTDTLHVDSTNNRVGIGNTNPGAVLDVTGAAHADTVASTGGTTNNRGMILSHQNNTNQSYVGRSENGAADTSNRITFDYDNDRMQLDSDGDIVLTPTSNVGIGTSSPSSYYATELVVDASDEGGISVVSGTTEAGYLAFADGTSGTARYSGYLSYDHNVDALTSRSAGYMNFMTGGGNERMRIDSSGRVGIAQDAPGDFNAAADDLVIGNSGGDFGITIRTGTASNGSIHFADGTTGDLPNRGIITYDHSDDHMQFNVAAAERMRIDSSGNLLVNQTSAGVNGKLQVTGGIGFTGDSVIRQSTNSDGSTLRFLGTQFVAGSSNAIGYSYSGGAQVASVSNSANVVLFEAGASNTSGHRLTIQNDATGLEGEVKYTGSEPVFILRDTRSAGGTAWSSTADEHLGEIQFWTSDSTGVGPHSVARIKTVNDITAASPAGRLSFFTSQYNDSSGGWEKMRIASNGTTSMYSGSTNTLQLNTSSSSSGTNNLIRAFSDSNISSGGTVRFVVYPSGNVQNSNNSYGQISDETKKENIVDATNKLDKLNQVRVRNFNFIGDDLKQIGVVAQELETIFPSMVEDIQDQDAEGNVLETSTKSVKYSVFVPILIKAIQEQQEQIETLKQEIREIREGG